MISFCDIYFCDLKTLCFYLASLRFSRVYIVMERGRNLTEKFREEIILVLIYSSSCVLVYMLT